MDEINSRSLASGNVRSVLNLKGDECCVTRISWSAKFCVYGLCPSGSRDKLIRSAINIQILLLVVTYCGLEVNTSVLKEQPTAIFRANLQL
jgi:hypothetical protein